MNPPSMGELMMWVGTILGVTAVIILRHFWPGGWGGMPKRKRAPARKRKPPPPRRGKPRPRAPPKRRKKK